METIKPDMEPQTLHPGQPQQTLQLPQFHNFARAMDISLSPVVQLSDMASVAPADAFKADVDGGENAPGQEPAKKIPQDKVPASVPAIGIHHLPRESLFREGWYVGTIHITNTPGPL